VTEFLPSDSAPDASAAPTASNWTGVTGVTVAGGPIPEWVGALISRAKAADGQPPFSDQSLVDLRTGARELIALDHDAAALLAPGEAEFVVDPDARGRGLGTAMLEGLLAGSPGELLIWAHGDHPAARALAKSHSLEAVRELLHLRLALSSDAISVDVDAPTSPATSTTSSSSRPSSAIELDAFRLGEDEDEWLAVNARAFVDHPEQGRVTRADLDELLSEDWFNADDFLVAREDGQIVGYCWLKVDAAGGEFYVVGIDPNTQGKGLGRRLTEAGLERLREREVTSAHLYVEADNVAAVRLYRSLGFENSSVDIQYRALAR
jgi:mycothiol synthase